MIAFPKAASGADPLTGAPAPVDEAQLRELGIDALDACPGGSTIAASRPSGNARLKLQAYRSNYE